MASTAEQYSQTGASLHSLTDTKLGFDIDSDDNDYDEVCTDTSSLHYKFDENDKEEEHRRKVTNVGSVDSIPQV